VSVCTVSGPAPTEDCDHASQSRQSPGQHRLPRRATLRLTRLEFDDRRCSEARGGSRKCVRACMGGGFVEDAQYAQTDLAEGQSHHGAVIVTLDLTLIYSLKHVDGMQRQPLSRSEQGRQKEKPLRNQPCSAASGLAVKDRSVGVIHRKGSVANNPQAARQPPRVRDSARRMQGLCDLASLDHSLRVCCPRRQACRMVLQLCVLGPPSGSKVVACCKPSRSSF
jgi:hypothetical protein